MNDKKLIKIKLIAWSIVTILLCVVLVNGIWGGRRNFFIWSGFNFGSYSGNMKEVKTYTFDKNENIKNINALLDTSDLIISENNEDNIKVIVRCSKVSKNKKYMDVNVDKNVLNIKDLNKNQNFLKFLKNYSLEVEVKIPKSYKNTLSIKDNVGDVDVISELDLKSLAMNVDTGDIETERNIKADKIVVDGNVGDIEFASLQGDTINIKGKIGDLEIDKFKGKGTIESKVGDIKCNIEDLTGDFDIKSKNGNVELNVNKKLSFDFEGNQNFGDIDTSLTFNNVSQSSDFFSGRYGKNPVGKISVNVKTGDISIND